MIRRHWLRTGLIILILVEGVPAVWAAVWPELFYHDFPLPGHPWIAMFPPYNDHLIRDLGMATLQFVVVSIFAAISLNPYLIRVALIGSFFFNVPHMAFHLHHMGRFALGDVAGQVVMLALPVVLAAVLLWLNRRIAKCGRSHSSLEANPDDHAVTEP